MAIIGRGSNRGTKVMLQYNRIEHLISPQELKDKFVVQVGVGSGGAPANQHLTMNGVRRWALFDPDTLDDQNLVKHPQTRNQIGRLKVENQRTWILDRNPAAEVLIFDVDVTTSEHFSEAVKMADIILCCADKSDVRLYVNTVAVENRKPCVTASVFRQGFGGEVYAFIPAVSGCFDCMNRAASEQGWNIEDAIDTTPEENEVIYGLNLRDFKASGLSMDIQTIAIIQARMTLDILIGKAEPKFTPLPSSNWIIFYNRPIPSIQDSGFLKRRFFKVMPRMGCPCRDLQSENH